MNPNQPKPTARERMQQAYHAARFLSAIVDTKERNAAADVAAKRLGIDPNEFRRLLRADQPPN